MVTNVFEEADVSIFRGERDLCTLKMEAVRSSETSQGTNCISLKYKKAMSFLSSLNHKNHIKRLYGHDADLFNVAASGTYSNQSALPG
jgi:hypothetical protein